MYPTNLKEILYNLTTKEISFEDFVSQTRNKELNSIVASIKDLNKIKDTTEKVEWGKIIEITKDCKNVCTNSIVSKGTMGLIFSSYPSPIHKDKTIVGFIKDIKPGVPLTKDSFVYVYLEDNIKTIGSFKKEEILEAFQIQKEQ